MIQFIAKDILAADRDLETATGYIKAIMDKAPAGEIISRGHNHSLTGLLVTPKKFVIALELKDSKYRVESLIRHLRYEGRNATAVHTDLHGLWLRFVGKYAEILFSISYSCLEKLQYFEQDKLFGEMVFDVFPNVRADIKEAGNCLALRIPIQQRLSN